MKIHRSKPARVTALWFALVLVLALAFGLGSPASVSAEVVVLNMYFPKPDKEADVLETRLVASAVRERIGVASGRVLKRVQGSEELPYVLWECVFENTAAHDRDMDARAGSHDFEAVRDRMGTLLARFERSLWNVEGPADPSDNDEGPGGITVLNWYYPKSETIQEVLSHRLHASDVRSTLGFPRGRVLRRMNEPTGTLPFVIWQMDYRDREARDRDAEGVSGTPEFQAVMEKMGTLLESFARGVYEVVEPLPKDATLR